MSTHRSYRAKGLNLFTAQLLSVVALAHLAAPAAAQQVTTLESLDAYFAAAAQEWQVPGMAVAIVKDDQVVFAKGYGVRDIERGGRVDEHTLFAIASNSKAFTAAALAILVDRGMISWDDPVRKYLPYFEIYDPFVSSEMRVRDLLCHRSGLGTYSGDLLWYGTEYSAEEVVRRARFLPAAGSFRAYYGYSNIMFIAAGEIIPAVTGRRWEDFVHEHFFDVLGMRNTVTSVRRLQDHPNTATPHGEVDGELVTFPWYNWDAMAAAGGIISSVSDMAQWLRLQLNRGTIGGNTVFSEEAARAMWTPHTPRPISRSSEELFPSTHFSAYGLGWGLIDYQGRKVVNHGGAYDGMFSRTAFVPEENLGLVVLTNSMTSLPRALMYRILDAYLGGEERDWSGEFLETAARRKQQAEERRKKEESQRVPNTRPSLPLEAYTGTYGGEMYGDAAVALEDGKLVVQFLPNPDLTGDLSHWHFDTFLVRWRQRFPWFGGGTVQFLMDDAGKVVEMKIDVPNEDFWFTELEFKRKP